MQQLVMTLTTISVITAFSLRSSEKLLLLWNRVKLLRMGCCFLKPVLQYLWACKKDWGTTDVLKGWQTCQWSPRRSPSFWSSTWTVGRPPGWADDSRGEGKWMPPSTAVHLHPAFPLPVVTNSRALIFGLHFKYTSHPWGQQKGALVEKLCLHVNILKIKT